MFKIQKSEISCAKNIDAPSFESDIPARSHSEPRITYLSKVDQHFWWHADPEQALLFPTHAKAAALIKTYRARYADYRSLIKVVRAPAPIH